MELFKDTRIGLNVMPNIKKIVEIEGNQRDYCCSFLLMKFTLVGITFSHQF
jgi:hypothetical protein